ncbi:hypothetical protein DFJ73DRAFT_85659 [Zopfochytrium polystomum]|nr:hypothetical protein DFJ73DRAFT_85659 [Zopfochytrium polystomum]
MSAHTDPALRTQGHHPIQLPRFGALAAIRPHSQTPAPMLHESGRTSSHWHTQQQQQQQQHTGYPFVQVHGPDHSFFRAPHPHEGNIIHTGRRAAAYHSNAPPSPSSAPRLSDSSSPLGKGVGQHRSDVWGRYNQIAAHDYGVDGPAGKYMVLEQLGDKHSGWSRDTPTRSSHQAFEWRFEAPPAAPLGIPPGLHDRHLQPQNEGYFGNNSAPYPAAKPAPTSANYGVPISALFHETQYRLQETSYSNRRLWGGPAPMDGPSLDSTTPETARSVSQRCWPAVTDYPSLNRLGPSAISELKRSSIQMEQDDRAARNIHATGVDHNPGNHEPTHQPSSTALEKSHQPVDPMHMPGRSPFPDTPTAQSEAARSRSNGSSSASIEEKALSPPRAGQKTLVEGRAKLSESDRAWQRSMKNREACRRLRIKKAAEVSQMRSELQRLTRENAELKIKLEFAERDRTDRLKVEVEYFRRMKEMKEIVEAKEST